MIYQVPMSSIPLNHDFPPVGAIYAAQVFSRLILDRSCGIISSGLVDSKFLALRTFTIFIREYTIDGLFSAIFQLVVSITSR